MIGKLLVAFAAATFAIVTTGANLAAVSFGDVVILTGLALVIGAIDD